MAEQERRSKKGRGSGEENVPAPSRATTKKGNELKKDMDELIDEIDDVLEENAEEFVKNYVQRGGE